jgi:hypothetical protein
MSTWSNLFGKAKSAPTTSDEIQSWVNALPDIYSAQMKYELPLAQSQKSAMESLYPWTSGLQENLAQQATEGMKSDVPSWMKQEYQSNMNAQLGQNAGAPIGADYMSRGLMEQKQNWKQYYQQMAASLSGKQPLATPSLNYAQSFSPQNVMQGMNQNYSVYSNTNNNNQNRLMSLLSSVLGSSGSSLMNLAGSFGGG